MKVFLEITFILVVFVVKTSGRSLEDVDKLSGREDVPSKNNLEESQKHLLEGDIIVPSGIADGGNEKRSLNVHKRWPNGIVHYEFSEYFTRQDQDSDKAKDIELRPSFERKMIYRVMESISNVSCVTFKERTTEQYWIKFVTNNVLSCSSSEGRQWRFYQPQEVYFHPNCFYTYGNIVHEVLHALGFSHEQSRPDRDKYVEILWENIKKGMESQFQIKTSSKTIGRNYDYLSIMHYTSTAFSKNGKDTIQPIQKKYIGQLGQRKGLSTGDIIDINLLYQCKDKIGYVGEWTEFDPCTVSCTQSRQRWCGSKENCPQIDENGIETHTKNCSYEDCHAPVDGHWGQWGSYAACTKTCGQERTPRTRTCTNPSPRNGGSSCIGTPIQTNMCVLPLCEARCGGEYNAEEEAGYVYSPGYPVEYPNDQNCIYRIHAPPGTFVKLTFSSTQLECGYDYVSIYYDSQKEKEIKKLCKVTESETFQSTGSEMVVVFTSDGWTQDKGFKANFEYTRQPPAT